MMSLSLSLPLNILDLNRIIFFFSSILATESRIYFLSYRIRHGDGVLLLERVPQISCPGGRPNFALPCMLPDTNPSIS